MKENYIKQYFKESCGSCEHRFTRIEHDEYPEYFCTHGVTDRPHCCSVAMGESALCSIDTEPHPYDIWDEWSESHEVDIDGLCDDYRKRIPNEKE